MAIYEKPVRALIPEMVADLAPERGHVFTKDQAVAWFAQHYPKIKEGTISAHLIRFSTNARSRLHYSPRSAYRRSLNASGGANSQATGKAQTGVRMRKRLAWLLFGVLALAGCSSHPAFVVLRDVPPHPSFVVIPSDDSNSGRDYASKVEAVLIRGSVSVIASPSTKEVLTERELGASRAEGDAAGVSEGTIRGRVTESYVAYEEIPADYMIQLDRVSSRMKVVKLKTRELLTVLTLPPDWDPAFERKIHEALRSIGLDVRLDPNAEPMRMKQVRGRP